MAERHSRHRASHQTRTWLQTEYNTAIARAHFAADWQEFERNKDVMPNLRWMPTTSPNPETTHRRFWEKKLTLPVDHPSWVSNHPGNRWNCSCMLQATINLLIRKSSERWYCPRLHRGLKIIRDWMASSSMILIPIFRHPVENVLFISLLSKTSCNICFWIRRKTAVIDHTSTRLWTILKSQRVKNTK